MSVCVFVCARVRACVRVRVRVCVRVCVHTFVYACVSGICDQTRLTPLAISQENSRQVVIFHPSALCQLY